MTARILESLINEIPWCLGQRRNEPAQPHDAPCGSVPLPPDKPSSGRAPAEYWMPWSELLRKTVGVDPEFCVCGARMVIEADPTLPS